MLVVLLTSLVACKNTDSKEMETQIETTVAETTEELPPITEMSLEEVLSHMSVQKKAAQMVQAERNSITPVQAKNYGIGSILSGGGSVPESNTAEGWAQMYNAYQSKVMTSANQIPIIYGVDAVHGHNNVFGATVFPHNIGLGATRNPALIYQIGGAVAKEVAATGVDWNFAPAVSVVQDIRWGRSYESFGESPELQTLLTAEYVKGLQESNMVATAKHFIADGGTNWDETKEGYKIDQGDALISDEEMRSIHLEGYKQAIAAGVDSVMISFSSINGEKMHANKALITDLLKNELGFEGIVISDWEAIHQLPGSFEEQVIASINAGVDMLMEPTQWQKTINTITNAVNSGEISQERLDDAVTRILKIKYKHNLIEEPLVTYTGEGFATEEHKALARQAVRESLVLLKNDDNRLPLNKNTNIFLIGPGIDNVGLQSGGWTLEWQGVSEADRVPGVSIKEAFESVAAENGAQIYTELVDAQKADVVVLVIGEKPYAEGVGDNGQLTLGSVTAMAGNLEAIEAAKKIGLPIVTIMLAGRPLLIQEELPSWQSFVMAWLPGSEGGAGIADVLYGDYDFKGKLSVSWPSNSTQFGYNVNVPDYNGELLEFAYGFGLTYQ